MNRICNNKCLSKQTSRKGIVMFVVLGTILVLGILVTSYNFFVRGKFNESRELLKHLRASKCAQALSNFVFIQMLNDLQAEKENSAGFILASTNDPGKLSEKFDVWVEKLDISSFVNSILTGETYETITHDVEFGFIDIQSLDSLKAVNSVDENICFFPNEKIGRLTIRATIKIGRSTEVWQETRPFKVVCPFPIPITKFSLYWENGVPYNDPYRFNTVAISAENGKPSNGKKPFLLDNGSSITGEDMASVWAKRGWIYIGGSDISLNRACGDTNYGQRFYSYPRPGAPATLMLDFPGGDNWDGKLYKGERLGFRVAYWGFSDAMLDQSSDNIWKKILVSEYKNNEGSSKYWLSSCLHLFSDYTLLSTNSSSEIVPSITRVVGNVYDRHLEMGYLLPVNSSSVIFGAVKNYTSKYEFDEAVKTEEPYSGESSLSSGDSYTIENYLYVPGGNLYGDGDYASANVLQSYLTSMVYENPLEPNAVSYRNVMSKITERTIDETYDVVSQYAQNPNAINLPPSPASPRVTDVKFKPSSASNKDLVETSHLPSNIANMDIPKISDVQDKTLGLGLRACYEFTGSSEEIKKAIERELLVKSGGSQELDLKKLVYKLNSSDNVLSLSGLRALLSPGAMYSKGALKVNVPNNTYDTGKNPLLLLAEKGAITLNNSSNRFGAYLVALGENGTVIAANKKSPLLINGGIATKDLMPENLPEAGGCLSYNSNLDPTVPEVFMKHIGVAFGPKGGKL